MSSPPTLCRLVTSAITFSALHTHLFTIFDPCWNSSTKANNQGYLHCTGPNELYKPITCETNPSDFQKDIVPSTHNCFCEEFSHSKCQQDQSLVVITSKKDPYPYMQLLMNNQKVQSIERVSCTLNFYLDQLIFFFFATDFILSPSFFFNSLSNYNYQV